MKTMKKLFALVLVMVMIMALALPVMAADPTTYPITIKPSDSENAGEHDGHTYEAYQILSGTASVGADGRTVLADIKWGTGFPVVDFLTALKSNTVFGAAGANLFDDLTSDDEGARKFAEKISMNSFSAAQKEALAQTVSSVISNFNKDKTDTEKLKPIASDNTAPYVLTVPAGYYMIKDKDGSLAGKENVDYTDIILQVSEEVDVHHKGSIPTVKKEVSEYNSEYGEYIGVAAGTEFYYKLIGTLPEDFANYDKYQYTFSDELSTGINYVGIERVFISRTTGEEELHQHSSTNPYGYQVEPDGNTVKIKFADLKHGGTNPHALKSSDKIVVIYKAKLNGNAVIGGTGNENKVKLEYSNNPNGEGIGFTSTDSTKTYTYGVRLEKYDGEKPDTKLKDVKFLLYREVSVSVVEGGTKISVIVKEYAEVVDNCIKDWHRQEYGTTAIPVGATEMSTDVNGIIMIRGLDSSKDYCLQETATNDGFNKIEDPIKFNLTAKLDTTTETITNVTATVTSDACHVDTANPTWEESGVKMGVNLKIPNYKGTVLPTTGGMGTTLFYLLGSILVIGAVVLLVTKKRMTY